MEAAIVTARPEDRNGAGVDVSEPGGLSRPTSAQQAADHIRRMIFDNDLHAGARVPQDEIAANLRVSRVPVREAVIALDREGWVTTETHRGALVNGLDEQTVLDHYEFMGMLYGFAARRATERGDAAGVARLVELNKVMQAANDHDSMWAANSAFLRQVLRMAQSRRIIAMARILAISIVAGKYFEQVPDVLRLHKKGMRAVLRAIRAGDGATAEEEYLQMLRAESVGVVALLRSRGHFSS